MSKLGKASIIFEKNKTPYITECASVVGQKEGEGPLGAYFDEIIEDPMASKDSWEEAESSFQKKIVALLLQKSGKKAEDIRYIFAGDLLGQLIATSFGIGDYQIPFFGLYGACSTMGESLSLAAMNVAAGYADHAIAMTSSHFASAEKQFRYPLEYGNQRPMSATWTVTGAGGVIVSRQKQKGKPSVRITGVTTGKIVDYGVTDSMNMGAAMAPAACDVIYTHFKDFQRSVKDYDAVYTGDLGTIGQRILLQMLSEKGIDIADIHHDCGIEIFDQETQDIDAGGSGCGCSAATLCALILRLIQEKKYRRVLFVPTGALLSTVSYNEGNPIPGIAHAVVLECEEEGEQ